jgi:uncharacterized caspase-like protein
MASEGICLIMLVEGLRRGPLPLLIALLVLASLGSSVVQGQANGGRARRGLEDTKPASAATPPAPVGPYYALVIGNNDYQHLNKLNTAVKDAEDVAQLLHDRYAFQTKVLKDATRAQILTALDDYRALPEKSNLLIYYAGHGHKDPAAHRAYWLPVDAERDHTPNWINATEIIDGIRAIPARHVLVIADSCFSGDLTMRDAGATISRHEHDALLAQVLQLKSRHIMSSGGDEPVVDTGTGSHSVFAAALLQSLNDMEGNAFTGEALLSQRLKPRVAGRSVQTPQYAILRDSDADLGDFVFFRSKLPATIDTKTVKGSGGLSRSIANQRPPNAEGSTDGGRVQLTGTITPVPEHWSKLHVMIDGQQGEATVDKYGKFSIPLLGASDRIRLRIYDDQKLVYDDYQLVASPLTITLRR